MGKLGVGTEEAAWAKLLLKFFNKTEHVFSDNILVFLEVTKQKVHVYVLPLKYKYEKGILNCTVV